MNQGKYSCLILVMSLLCSMAACEGGEVFLSQRTPPSTIPINHNLDNEIIADEMPAGEYPSGEMLAGEYPSGEMFAGEVVEDCGLTSNATFQGFTEAPLGILVNSCSECHNPQSFRRFKLDLNASDLESGYNAEQVASVLNAVEPFINPGDGTGSELASKMIDDHARVLFNADSPEYSRVVSWIDNIIECD